MGPNPMTRVLIKGEETDTQTGRGTSEDRGRDWSDAATGQGTPRIAGYPQELSF